jgi:2'-5' RNA ligase
MKGKTHKTAVVLIPPETLWPPIQKIRQKYDHQFRRWMPHITLLYPFWPVSELPYLRDRFSGICDSLNAFQITLKTFHCFQHSKQNCTVWLSPEPADALTDLQTLLWKTFPDCNDVRHFSGGFTPHLSIGQVHGKNSAARLIERLARKWDPLQYRVSEFHVIWRGEPPDDIFRVAQSFRFSNGMQC